MFNTLLIANRGEIACRIIKTAHRLGIKCIAIYSTADQDSLHVKMADKAYCVGAPEARASYLNIDAIISVAKKSGAEAIHPGYGFLSENPAFVEACQEAGIIFVGPTLKAMTAMASKQLAKQLLEEHAVPLTPGYHDDDQGDNRLQQEASKIGYPVLLKAANGGGGKGMRIVQNREDFQQSLDSARREAIASFGDDIMIIEKYISHPRHVEIQLMADNFGNVVHLFERDCSIQRRHQKIIEEAPAPNLSEALRSKLAKAAITVARAIEYRGAGTVEFLVDSDSSFYFMEMNTRLQVEHPVTEMITGIDLVEWQLRVAANETLPKTQEQIKAEGHAIECRIYAEDPHHQFLPSTGTIDFLNEPRECGIRIDTGIELHSEITRYYDPMIAKLIAYGSSRDEARQRLTQAINHYSIGGVKTNIPLLEAIIKNPNFKGCQLSTHFLNEHTLPLISPCIKWGVIMATCIDYLNLTSSNNTQLDLDTFGWQMHSKRHWKERYLVNQEKHEVIVTPINQDTFQLAYREETLILKARQIDSLLTVDDGTQTQHAHINQKTNQIELFTSSGRMTIQRTSSEHQAHKHTATESQLKSPMPSTIVAILKTKGEKINAGDPLIVLEAMKMEHMILAPGNGVLTEVFFEVGAQVNEGVELVSMSFITPEENS